MESLHCLNIFWFRVHPMIIRIIDTNVEFGYLLLYRIKRYLEGHCRGGSDVKSATFSV